MKKFFFVFLCINILFLATEEGYARRNPDKPRKKDRKENNPTNCEPGRATFTVTINNGKFDIPQIRSNSWQTCPILNPSPWGGQVSANSLYDQPYNKYYCLITIATECVSWGENGVETTIWNSNTNSKTVYAPTNIPFRVSVEYYEPCGNYWKDNTISRGRWYSEDTILNYTPQVTIDKFLFTNKENC